MYVRKVFAGIEGGIQDIIDNAINVARWGFRLSDRFVTGGRLILSKKLKFV
jgi:hypothetical protein